MTLDNLRVLLNRLRRLEEDENSSDEKIQDLRKEIADILSGSNAKVKIKASFEREVHMYEFGDYDWIIDTMLEDSTLTQQDIITNDIVNNVEDYVSLDGLDIIIEDENGNELDSLRAY